VHQQVAGAHDVQRDPVVPASKDGADSSVHASFLNEVLTQTDLADICRLGRVPNGHQPGNTYNARQ